MKNNNKTPTNRMTKTNRNKNNTNSNGRGSQRPPRQGAVLPSRNNRQYGISRFTSVVDPVVTNTYANPPTMATIKSEPGGFAYLNVTLTARGLNAYSTTAAGQVAVTGSHLPWMASTCRNFGSYRISRASLVLAGSIGSTTPGKVAVHVSKDFEDVTTTYSIAAPGGTMFDLASLATRNKVIPLRVNTEWKKVTDITTVSVGGVVTVINSANDLVIGTYVVVVAGAPPSTDLMDMYIEYDVEFANPMSVGLNG